MTDPKRTPPIDSDALIHVYYWGKDLKLPDGYKEFQYKGKPWSYFVNGDGSPSPSDEAGYFGIDKDGYADIIETASEETTIAVANGIEGSSKTFQLLTDGEKVHRPVTLAGGDWHAFSVRLNRVGTTYHIYEVSEPDPRFKIRYKGG